MNDTTLLALAGTGLALLFLSGGSATVARVNSKLNALANIYHEDFEDGFDMEWDDENNAKVSYCMQGLLAIAESISQKQSTFHTMTKLDLMNIVRVDVGDYDRGAISLIRKLRNWAIMFDEREDSFMDGPLKIRPGMIPPVKAFVAKSVDIMQEALGLISDIFKLLPGESEHSARTLVQAQSDELVRLKLDIATSKKSY